MDLLFIAPEASEGQPGKGAEFFDALAEHTSKCRWTRAFDQWTWSADSYEIAIVGLHGRCQVKRARVNALCEAPRNVVAMVELFAQWTPEYLHSHGSGCAETLGWATHVLAPRVVADELRAGPMASASSYADHLRRLAHDLRDRHRNGEPRHRPIPVTDKDVEERAQRFFELAEHLDRAAAWRSDRIVAYDLPDVRGFLAGEKLTKGARAPANRPSVAWIDQGHTPEVREDVAAAAAHLGLSVVDVRRDGPRGEKLAALEGALVVATEYSNLAYQVALHGRRVLYCPWRSGARPLPSLHPAFGTHVRTAWTPGEISPLLADALANRWPERDEPIEVTPGREILAVLQRCVAT